MIRERIKYVDKLLIVPYFMLTLFSIIMIYSASSYSALSMYDNPHYYLPRQAIFVALSYVMFTVAFFFPLKLMRNKKLVMFGTALTFFSLVLLLMFGREIYGAKRWIETPFINIQPAELTKFMVIWYLAYILSKKQKLINNDFFKAIVAPLILVVGIVLSIYIQPDTGSSFIIVIIAAIMIFASGVSPKLGAGFGFFGIASLAGLTKMIETFGTKLFFLDEYRYERFLGFWDPFALAEGAGLQLVNSYYALSRGGLFGVGFGDSVQKTGYLPFPYTDFIISIIGEELGLLGLLVLFSVFTLMVSRMILIAIRSKNAFNSLLCIGVASMFLIQSSINLMGVVGLMPITGLTFPFISYGGTSLMVLSISLGLVANVSAHLNYKRAKKSA
ncbi:MAG: FtsW/RodA/SpoVE family cell cycle protein [Alkalibacterium gilvum]|uniref:Probable peptidoglycan glycosyltransferase FtsW n=1 Tax=Alkalibacterium gilvum TaxID=1130080 RepID=A0A1H6STL4_9LACT|nr:MULTISPECIES: FtsW/RodA/SpoVE family cell cycle protein [Alkalibacterium]MDN6193429.1 FtsW/RodA/SpoVE family cell cycle protein [Alkalibacterium sp.]MDN6294472.1 FtsW/RodA/SpoVE family cell cycle protein [Alkalibacterium sp.]MDN6295902.1 FtsW/RodA/SpoVE family cell cycle protein [Alkalibacterium sp.]MDN6385297.1 FtsW/RodA/SpoVE family cell cycle protein [Alkalibacterium sp.]MDN6398295.1 FtsW/RodA/SpoVE family cell cycle protein [Alkalibacterium sp.]